MQRQIACSGGKRVSITAGICSVLMVFATQPAAAQLDCYAESVGSNGDCNTDGFESHCWYDPHQFAPEDPQVAFAYNNFHLHMSLAEGFGPGDYPPRKLDPRLSSLPLVSNEVRHLNGPTPHRERPTHRDVIDLITGAPLLQATDFELPFGGAVFRHIRTYSQNIAFHMFREVGHENGPNEKPMTTRWDWNGLFWSMGESPIFLIDAQYDFTKEYETEPTPIDKRCYFLPDAHHAIPFIYDEVQELYLAPPWFDAVLSDDGQNPPDYYYVRLSRRSIKYTIRAFREDLWEIGQGTSVHEHPDDGGLGLPYYGLVERIEDRYGNAVVYEYCDTHHREQCDVAHSSSCVECCQTCNQKGQIKSIRLVRSDDTVVWTLLYCHRSFGYAMDLFMFLTDGAYESDLENGTIPAGLRDDFATSGITFSGSETVETQTSGLVWLIQDGELRFTIEDNENWPGQLRVSEQWGWRSTARNGDNAVHSIHVYEGDVATTSGCPTLPADDFCHYPPDAGIAGLDELDALDCQVPGNWVIEAKYLYSDGWGSYPWHTGPPMCPTSKLYEQSIRASGYGDTGPIQQPQKLLKVSVTKRTSAAGQDATETQHTLYRYSDTTGQEIDQNNGASIRAVFGPSTVDAILAAEPDKTVNDLLNLPPDEIIDMPDPQAPASTSGSEFIDLADLEFKDWRNTDYDSFVAGDQGSDDYKMREFVGIPDTHSSLQTAGKHALVDRRVGAGNHGAFIYYRYIALPPDAIWDYCGESCPQVSMVHYPYRFWDHDGAYVTAPLDHVFWVTIIDEYDEGVYDKNLGDIDLNDAVPRSRRVVKMNSAGFVLVDQIFKMADNGTGELVSQEGFSTEESYDCKGRVVERRSTGWSACTQEVLSECSPEGIGTNGCCTDAGNTLCCPAEQGLIYIFRYDDEPCDVAADGFCQCTGNGPGEVLAVGIKQGTEGTVYWLSQVQRDEDRPELITAEVRFREPTADLLAEVTTCGATGELTQIDYVFLDPIATNGDPSEKRIRQKMIIRPAVPLEWGGDARYAVDKSYYDDHGNLEWRGVGSLADPDTPGQGDFFFPIYTEHTSLGRLELQRVDAASKPGGGGPPSGFERTVPDSDINPPLLLDTNYNYDNTYGLTQVLYPGDPDGDRREKRVAYVKRDGLLEQWTFDNILVPDDGDFELHGPVQINRFDGPNLVSAEQVAPDSTDGEPDGKGDEESYEVVTTLTPQYDAQGRLVGMTRDARGVEGSIGAGISYDGWGQIARQQAADGTITRNTYDGLGRLQKVYRGTNDIHDMWGTGISCDENGLPPGCCDEEKLNCNFPDNLVLLERRYYGNSVTDAGQLVTVRDYRERPDNQYSWDVGTDGLLNPAPNEDDIGWTTLHRYDWRMREVWITQRDAQSNGLTHTLVWYDHMDRVRFVAEYGDDMPDSDTVNPALLGPESVFPSPSSILGESPAPLSLTENVYNARSQVGEVRRYDVTESDGETYTSTFTWCNHADQPTEVRAPDSLPRRYEYDAKGRQILSWTELLGQQITKTRTIYNNVTDVAILTIRYERMHEATSNGLNEGNSVITYVYSWYDDANRLIATADFGTNEDTYTTSSGDWPLEIGSCEPGAGCYDPDTPPTAASLPGARVTCYEYDGEGRQSKVIDPGGIATRTEYDGLGRVVMVTENADGGADEQRHTAYYFDASTSGGTGQLTMVAAVEPGNFNGTAEWQNIQWTATDGSIQVTRYVYNAVVVHDDDSGELEGISSNGAWIGAVHYPDPETGQPEATPSVRFRYYPDGLLAERTDARGVTLRYEYDALDRLEAIRVIDVPEGVDATVEAMTYQHTPDGMVAIATTIAAGTGTNGVTLNTASFDYDGMRHLEFVDSGIGLSGIIGYTWEVSTVSWDQFDPRTHSRLTAITYPDIGHAFLGYSSAGGIDDRLSRLVAITDPLDSGHQLVSYRYMGLGRLVGMTLGNGIGMDYEDGAPGTDVVGLDQFGRVIDIPYATSSGTVLRYQYGYDKRGNRKFARISEHVDDQSWLYGYDDLNRLIRASRGTLNSTGDGFIGDDPESTTWDLDMLGNWSGDSGSNDISLQRFTDANADGVYDQGSDTLLATDHHNTNQLNEIESRVIDAFSTNGAIDFVHDGAGNLVFDGERFYVYDAWNRLVQIHEPGNLAVDTNGQLTGEPGEAILRYEYDALGRRVRTIEWAGSTLPKATRHVYGGGPEVLVEYGEGDDVGTSGPALTVERWFLHGEAFPDPLVMVDRTDLGEAPADEDEYLYYLKDALGSVGALANRVGNVVERYTYDPYGRPTVWAADGSDHTSALPLTYFHDADRDTDIDDADRDHLLDCATNGPTDPACVFAHDRDGDHFIGMDDLSLFLEFEDFESGGTPPPPSWRRPGLVAFDIGADNHIDLFDANGFALCFATTCGASGCGPGGCEPGGCIEADLCLFVFDSDDDNDIDQTDWAAMAAVLGGPATARLPGDADASRFGNPFLFTGQRYDPATGLYHFWARTYDPVLGRWLQRDKLGALAASGDVSLSSGAYGPTLFVAQFAPGDEYGDGFSLYQYVNSRPINVLDPYGLFDWFDEADAITTDIWAGRAAAAYHAMDRLRHMAQQAATTVFYAGLAYAVPGVGLYLSIQGMAAALEDIAYNDLNWNNCLSLGLSFTGAVGSAAALPSQVSRTFAQLRRFGTGMGRAIARGRAAYGRLRGKPVNLPSASKVTINMWEVESGHMMGGSRRGPNSQKGLFPEYMTEQQVEQAVRTAYKNCSKTRTQGERVKLVGEADGLVIEMWLNTSTNTIETAYPIGLAW
ncbi:MAG TPA: RHS repeat-associated core domain-containing protein [Phycisphaerae bacterium]|nr:RHS repeat-associated core domain-containing protein [Phycisphaerae bacterium]